MPDGKWLSIRYRNESCHVAVHLFVQYQKEQTKAPNTCRHRWPNPHGGMKGKHEQTTLLMGDVHATLYGGQQEALQTALVSRETDMSVFQRKGCNPCRHMVQKVSTYRHEWVVCNLVVQSYKAVPESSLLKRLVVGCRPMQLTNAKLLHPQAPQRALTGCHKLPYQQMCPLACMMKYLTMCMQYWLTQPLCASWSSTWCALQACFWDQACI